MENSLIRGGAVFSPRELERRTFEALADTHEQAQRAAKLRDWKAFRRLMNQFYALHAQGQALVG